MKYYAFMQRGTKYQIRPCSFISGMNREGFAFTTAEGNDRLVMGKPMTMEVMHDRVIVHVSHDYPAFLPPGYWRHEIAIALGSVMVVHHHYQQEVK